MSSIITNNAAMSALQTLRGINNNMMDVQNQINSGKHIGSAKDNAAIWSIAATMETDVTGFKAVSESLNLGNSTLEVARKGTETIKGQLEKLKGVITTAQTPGVDRFKLQQSVEQMVGQINTVVESASFNGVSVLKSYDDVEFLASLNRDANGTVTTSNISFQKQDLTTKVSKFGTKDAEARNIDMAVTAPSTAKITFTNTPDTATLTVAFPGGGNDPTNGDHLHATIAGETIDFLAGADAAATGGNLRAAIQGSQALIDKGITLDTSDTGAGANIVLVDSTGEHGSDALSTLTVTNDDNAGKVPTLTKSDTLQALSGSTAGTATFSLAGENITFTTIANDTLANQASALSAAINGSAAMTEKGISASVDGDSVIIASTDATKTYTISAAAGTAGNSSVSEDNTLEQASGGMGADGRFATTFTGTATADGTLTFDFGNSNTVAVAYKNGDSAAIVQRKAAEAINSSGAAKGIGVSASLTEDGKLEINNSSSTKIDVATAANADGLVFNLASGATLAASTATNGDGEARFSIGGSASTDGKGAVTVAGVQINTNIVKDQSAADIAASFASAINGNTELKALGISARADDSGAVTVTTVNKFTNLTIENATSSATGADPTINDSKLGRRSVDVDLTDVAVKEGQGYQIVINKQEFNYVAKKGDSMTDVAKGFESMINGDKNMVSQGIEVKLELGAGNPKVMIGGKDGAAPTVTVSSNTIKADGEAAGGLRGLESLDVTTADGAKAALGRIEGLIQSAISASAAIGAAQERMESQVKFVKDVKDGLSSGVGALVDADMEEVSARLQALQVQQQLGVQALSIANQQPQSILSLFR